MLLEIAIGDAYGGGFEFCEFPGPNNLERYYKHPNEDFTTLPAGSYTDDTQMTLALAEMVIDGIEVTPHNLADKFVEVFKRDPRDGYARGFQKFLESIDSGDEFLEKIKPNSTKSGAAMRACPFGWFETLPEVIENTTVQAKMTHDTHQGILSAQLVSTSVWQLLNGATKEELKEFLMDYFELDHEMLFEYEGRVGGQGMDCVSAALTAFMRCDDAASMLVQSVNFKGDVDTIAAIAMGLASVSNEIIINLPKNLHDGLERTKYGYDYLLDLDAKLVKKMRGSR